MINLKKVYSNELLQLALLLSLLRVDPESYLGLDMLTIGIGSLDLHNGSGWHTDAHTIVHRPMFVHPKNLDSVLLNYERDLFEDLNTLGRYNRINGANNDIQAYLLNVGDKSEEPGTSATETNSTSDGQSDDPDPPTESQTTDEPSRAADLTQEVEDYLFLQI